MFYYFRLEDQIPENDLLRLIDKHTSFSFVRERLKDSYSETGRPSIDPELLRILLIGYLYGKNRHGRFQTTSTPAVSPERRPPAGESRAAAALRYTRPHYGVR